MSSKYLTAGRWFDSTEHGRMGMRDAVKVWDLKAGGVPWGLKSGQWTKHVPPICWAAALPRWSLQGWILEVVFYFQWCSWHCSLLIPACPLPGKTCTSGLFSLTGICNYLFNQRYLATSSFDSWTMWNKYFTYCHSSFFLDLEIWLVVVLVYLPAKNK